MCVLYHALLPPTPQGTLLVCDCSIYNKLHPVYKPIFSSFFPKPSFYIHFKKGLIGHVQCKRPERAECE